MGNQAEKFNFDTYLQRPQVQIIGTEGQFHALRQMFAEMVDEAVQRAFQAGRDYEKDPMSRHPESAPAAYWAGQKFKANGKPYSKRSFERWAKEYQICRLENNNYDREAGRKWLFG